MPDTAESPGLAALFRAMVLARALDERLSLEARRGSLEQWKPGGCEAALVGVAAALSERDWLFAGGLDLGAALARGISPATILAHVFASAKDPTRGRAPAPRLATKAPPLGSYGYHNGAHLVHAAGAAWAARTKRDDAIAVALFDADEVASGEFHNALNFAGVLKLPVLFISIRRPTSLTSSVAGRGVAYGIPAVSCDGGDVLAVIREVTAAAARARRGEGAMLIEAHASDSPLSDVVRFERVLVARGLEAELRSIRDQAEKELAHAFEQELEQGPDRMPAPPLDAVTMFDDVYGVAPDRMWHLAAQRAALKKEEG
jgi:pyruvate dehydrogenase E1 component alpha subunit/2-oxoisovalerate dehydrogenase E1 component alpha subunit